MSGDRDDWDKYLTPHYTYVVKNLQLSPVLDELKQKGLINREEYKRQRKLIKNECDEDGTRNLLTEILPKKGPTSFKEFLEVLKKTDQQHIADRLLPKVMELQGPSFRENMQRAPQVDRTHSRRTTPSKRITNTTITEEDGRPPSKKRKEEKLRVLTISDGWSSTKGGVQTFNRLLCKAISKNTDVVQKVACVLVGSGPTREEEQNAKKSNVDLLAMKDEDIEEQLSKIAPDVVISHQGVKDPEQETRELRNLLKGRNPYRMVYFLHTYPPALEDSKQSDPASSIREGLKKRQEQLDKIEQADIVVTVGPYLYELWEALTGDKPFIAFKPGIYDLPLTRRKVNKRTRILFMSRLNKEDVQKSKGLPVARKAMSFYSKDHKTDYPTTFVVIGFPSEEEAGKFKTEAEKAMKKAVQVEPMLYEPKESNIRRELAAADVFLMVSQHEGFGLAALEALSVGTPVICTKNSGFAAMLQDLCPHAETGKLDSEYQFINNWVVPDEDAYGEDDEDAYARKVSSRLRSMLGSKKSREAAFKEAEKLRERWSEKYSWEVATKRLLEKCRDP